MVEPLKLVDARICDALGAICGDLKLQAERALHLCGVETSQQLREVPAKRALEMAGRMSGHAPLIEAMPVIGVDLETLVKTVSVLKCRLRLGADLVDGPKSPHHAPLPTLPVTTRARRELRPGTPALGASRPGKLALSRRSTVILQNNRNRSKVLRTERNPIAKPAPAKSRLRRPMPRIQREKSRMSPPMGAIPNLAVLELTPDVLSSMQMVKQAAICAASLILGSTEWCGSVVFPPR